MITDKKARLGWKYYLTLLLIGMVMGMVGSVAYKAVDCANSGDTFIAKAPWFYCVESE